MRSADAVFGIAETYGVSNEKPAYQVGLRYWAIPARLQIDGTYGWQHASPDESQLDLDRRADPVVSARN